MSRINFTAQMVGDTSLPGVQFLINRIKARGTLQPEQLVDTALDLMGPLEVGIGTRQELLTHANEGGELRWDDSTVAEQRVAQLLQLVVATREYQFN
jgi:hypothetical protein